MNKDVVLIPAYNRPEFLIITLEHIAKNPDSKEYLYLFSLDIGFKRELLQIIERFKKQGHQVKVRRTPRTISGLGKQSYNVLTGYQLARDLCEEFVFLIEEDIFVSNDFFKWHKEVHKIEPDIFCSIATRDHSIIYKTQDDLTLYYKSHSDYQSWGVCFRKYKLDLFLKHATPDYYNDPRSYVPKTFPDSKWKDFFVEQDGLIRRVQEENYTSKIVFPHVPRAFHAGFYGYNRGSKITGTLPEKIEKLRKVCFNDEEMRLANKVDNFYEDSRPENLNIEHWNPPLKEEFATEIKGVKLPE